MSFTEILEEIPRLSHQERRELFRRMMDLESGSEEIQAAHQTADQAFQILDRLEAEDVANGAGPAR